MVIVIIRLSTCRLWLDGYTIILTACLVIANKGEKGSQYPPPNCLHLLALSSWDLLFIAQKFWAMFITTVMYIWNSGTLFYHNHLANNYLQYTIHVYKITHTETHMCTSLLPPTQIHHNALPNTLLKTTSESDPPPPPPSNSNISHGQNDSHTSQL